MDGMSCNDFAVGAPAYVVGARVLVRQLPRSGWARPVGTVRELRRSYHGGWHYAVSWGPGTRPTWYAEQELARA